MNEPSFEQPLVTTFYEYKNLFSGYNNAGHFLPKWVIYMLLKHLFVLQPESANFSGALSSAAGP
jgi:hypothetical protein